MIRKLKTRLKRKWLKRRYILVGYFFFFWLFFLFKLDSHIHNLRFVTNMSIYFSSISGVNFYCYHYYCYQTNYQSEVWYLMCKGNMNIINSNILTNLYLNLNAITNFCKNLLQAMLLLPDHPSLFIYIFFLHALFRACDSN